MESLRRVPWSSKPSEFAECFRLLFTAEGNQQEAVQMMRLWISRGSCPPAIESTAALLQAMFLEQALSAGQLSSFALRQCYASAIVRFVNGLVDPMQQSFTARSVGHIAAQIGLPQHFVDLRHAATHEDLPRLEILKRSTREALGWLYERYWVPSMDQLHSQPEIAAAPTQDFATLIKEQVTYYKDMSKKGLRDVSQAKPKELLRICAYIEKLAASAASTANSLAETMEIGTSSSVDQASAKHAHAYDFVVEALLAPGSLVPTSKKKRVGVHNKRLSAESTDTWLPLIDYFAANTPGFISCLLRRLIEATKSTAATGNSKREDGYIDTIHFWLETLFERLHKKEKGLYRQCLHWSLLTRSPRSLEFAEHLIAVEGNPEDAAQAQILLAHAKKTLQPVSLFSPSLDSSEASDRLSRIETRRVQTEKRIDAEEKMDVDEESLDSNEAGRSYGRWTEVVLKQPMCIGAVDTSFEYSSLILR